MALARALIRRPQALLLDEPFSALDNPLRWEMRRFLKHIHSEFTIPVILVTHDLLEAASLADTIFIYHGGAIVQSGSPQEIINRPLTPEVAALVQLPEPALPHRLFLSKENGLNPLGWPMPAGFGKVSQ